MTAPSAEPLLVSQCSDYIDPGATASDNLDDDALLTEQIITSSSIGSFPLDTSILGIATVFYVSERGKIRFVSSLSFRFLNLFDILFFVYVCVYTMLRALY